MTNRLRIAVGVVSTLAVIVGMAGVFAWREAPGWAAGGLLFPGRPGPIVRRAFARAELQGRFQVDAVSPVNAAKQITVPVLLIHGAQDHETSPAHTRRIYDALQARRTLLMVEGAGHNQSLTPETWQTIEKWMDDVLAQGGGGH